MKRTARLIVTAVTFGVVVAAMVVGPMPAIGQSAPGRSTGVRQDAINRLRAGAVGTVTLSIDGGTRYVGFARVSKGGDLLPGSASGTPAGKARGFFAKYAPLFGITDAFAELRQVSSEKDAYGMTHVSYDQTYKGLPVFGGMLRATSTRATS